MSSILTPGAASISANALTYGTLSGLSLPIGAALGIMLSPVSDKLCGGVMAFGSGALIFAVTVSIYGKELIKYEVGLLQRYEDWLQILGGLAGSVFYLYVARWLDEDGGEQPRDAEKHLMQERTPLVACDAAGNTHRAVVNPGENAARDVEDQMLHKSSSKSCVLKDAALAMTDNADAEGQLGMRTRSKSSTMLDAVLAFTEDEDQKRKRKGKQIAYSLFLGLLIDGVPEGVFMGFLAARRKLSMSLVASLFIANFPEAFSSASLLERAGMGYLPIIAMWAGLMFLVGSLTGISCLGLLWSFPAYAKGHHLPPIAAASVSFIEGFTGGAMLACIVAVMLPDAQHRIGKGQRLITQPGFLTTAGFLCSLAVELMYPPL